MTNGQIILCKSEPPGARKCLACGADGIKPRRRYCSSECREQMMWVLSLSKGLLRVFNARYAAFSFDKSYVVLDVLPIWSREISRFLFRRRSGKKPAEDLKTLILRSAEEWYCMINNRNSRSWKPPSTSLVTGTISICLTSYQRFWICSRATMPSSVT